MPSFSAMPLMRNRATVTSANAPAVPVRRRAGVGRSRIRRQLTWMRDHQANFKESEIANSRKSVVVSAGSVG